VLLGDRLDWLHLFPNSCSVGKARGDPLARQARGLFYMYDVLINDAAYPL